jgi:hypothetical protein
MFGTMLDFDFPDPGFLSPCNMERWHRENSDIILNYADR